MMILISATQPGSYLGQERPGPAFIGFPINWAQHHPFDRFEQWATALDSGPERSKPAIHPLRRCR